MCDYEIRKFEINVNLWSLNHLKARLLAIRNDLNQNRHINTGVVTKKHCVCYFTGRSILKKNQILDEITIRNM